MPPERSSLPAVDYIKSAAILAVMVQHSVPVMFDRRWTPTETTIFAIVSFHVPVFLFIAGFLSHADTAVSWRDVVRRLQRIVPPYLVATAAVCLLGLADVPTVRRLVFVTVTGSAFGHYYFVPILIFCVLLLPAVSRLSTGTLIGGTLLLLIACAYLWLLPAWRLDYPLFWQVRHPILQFHLGFFLLGVVAARLRPELERIGVRYRFATIGLAGGLVALFAILSPWTDHVFHPAVRTAYVLAVMALIASSTPRHPAPTWIRFLSDATFTIYLYHWVAYIIAGTLFLSAATPLLVRTAVQILSGLALSTVIVVVGRRVLGSWSRLVVGT